MDLNHKFENTDSHIDDRTPCDNCDELMRDVDIIIEEIGRQFYYCCNYCAEMHTFQRAMTAQRAIQFAKFIN